jgi:hypothetical protein
MEQWWNDTDRGKADVLGEKAIPMLLCPSHILLESNMVLCCDRPETNRLSNGTAYHIGLFEAELHNT